MGTQSLVYPTFHLAAEVTRADGVLSIYGPRQLTGQGWFLPLNDNGTGLGLHAFVRGSWPFWVGIKVSNGHRADREDFPGATFVKRLRIRIEPVDGDFVARAAPAPALGRAVQHGRSFVWDLVGQDGAWFPARAVFNRRFGFASNEREAELMATEGPRPIAGGVSRPTSTPLNLPHGNGLVSSERVANALDRVAQFSSPHATMGGIDISWLGERLNSAEPGSPFASTGNPLYHGEAGGQGLEVCPGWEGSAFSYPLRTMLHDRTVEGGPVACWDDQGDPAYLGRGDLPEYSLARGWNKLGQLRSCGVESDNRYDDTLVPKVSPGGGRFTTASHESLFWRPEDWQHGIRNVRHGIAALEWAARHGDPLIELDLHMHAAEIWWSWRPSGPKPAYGYTPHNLPNLMAQARSFPGWGFPALGREFGWVAYFVGWAMRQPWMQPQQRRWHAWLDAMCKLAREVQMANGLTQRISFSGSGSGLNPDPWLQNGVPPTVDVAQAIEPPIVAAGARSLQMACLEIGGRFNAHAGWMQDIILFSAHSMYDRMAAPVPKWIAVARKGQKPLRSLAAAGQGGIETFNLWWHLAICHEINRHAFWETVMLRHPLPGQGVPLGGRETLIAQMKNANDDTLVHVAPAYAVLTHLA